MTRLKRCIYSRYRNVNDSFNFAHLHLSLRSDFVSLVIARRSGRFMCFVSSSIFLHLWSMRVVVEDAFLSPRDDFLSGVYDRDY